MNHIEECQHCGTIAAIPQGYDDYDDFYTRDTCSCGLERYVAYPDECDCDFCEATKDNLNDEETPEPAATDAGENNESDQHSLPIEPTRPTLAVAHLEHAGQSTGREYVLHDGQRVPMTGEYIRVIIRRDALAEGIRNSLVFRACPCCVENHDDRVRAAQRQLRIEREVRARVEAEHQ